jgi:phytoene synthase
MGDVVVRATEPALAAIKLAWWREQLERLDTEAPPAEPRLQAVSTALLPKGISGHDLAALEPGWTTLLDNQPEARLVEERGEKLFALAARLLGASHAGLTEAGRLYALMDVSRRGLHDFRGSLDGRPLPPFPPPLRPLTGLASLARRDLKRETYEAEATPGRSWALIRHRMTGRT